MICRRSSRIHHALDWVIVVCVALLPWLEPPWPSLSRYKINKSGSHGPQTASSAARSDTVGICWDPVRLQHAVDLALRTRCGPTRPPWFAFSSPGPVRNQVCLPWSTRPCRRPIYWTELHRFYVDPCHGLDRWGISAQWTACSASTNGLKRKRLPLTGVNPVLALYFRQPRSRMGAVRDSAGSDRIRPPRPAGVDRHRDDRLSFGRRRQRCLVKWTGRRGYWLGRRWRPMARAASGTDRRCRSRASSDLPKRIRSNPDLFTGAMRLHVVILAGSPTIWACRPNTASTAVGGEGACHRSCCRPRIDIGRTGSALVSSVGQQRPFWVTPNDHQADWSGWRPWLMIAGGGVDASPLRCYWSRDNTGWSGSDLLSTSEQQRPCWVIPAGRQALRSGWTCRPMVAGGGGGARRRRCYRRRVDDGWAGSDPPSTAGLRRPCWVIPAGRQALRSGWRLRRTVGGDGGGDSRRRYGTSTTSSKRAGCNPGSFIRPRRPCWVIPDISPKLWATRPFSISAAGGGGGARHRRCSWRRIAVGWAGRTFVSSAGPQRSFWVIPTDRLADRSGWGRRPMVGGGGGDARHRRSATPSTSLRRAGSNPGSFIMLRRPCWVIPDGPPTLWATRPFSISADGGGGGARHRRCYWRRIAVGWAGRTFVSSAGPQRSFWVIPADRLADRSGWRRRPMVGGGGGDARHRRSATPSTSLRWAGSNPGSFITARWSCWVIPVGSPTLLTVHPGPISVAGGGGDARRRRRCWRQISFGSVGSAFVASADLHRLYWVTLNGRLADRTGWRRRRMLDAALGSDPRWRSETTSTQIRRAGSNPGLFITMRQLRRVIPTCLLTLPSRVLPSASAPNPSIL
jgi:hypothetical protein